MKSFAAFLFGGLLVLSFLHAVLGNAADTAINWEAEQFKAHAAPYAGRCLGFVKDAYAQAGVSRDYLSQGNAKEGGVVASGKPGWNKYTGHDVPRGAVLFWEGCSSNGHAALSIGGGSASSSGDGDHWNGSPDVSIDWLNKHWCGGDPNGWILP